VLEHGVGSVKQFKEWLVSKKATDPPKGVPSAPSTRR